jgi:hypothetical protein
MPPRFYRAVLHPQSMLLLWKMHPSAEVAHQSDPANGGRAVGDPMQLPYAVRSVLIDNALAL